VSEGVSAGAARATARRAARLAAVQALYQMDMTGQGVEGAVREYLDHRLIDPVPGPAGETADDLGPLGEADEAFFAALVRGVVAEQAAVDGEIVKRLQEGWRLTRLDSIVRAILRAGTYELLRRPDVPVPVVIDEYVGLVGAFFDGPESGFVNGLLDRLARETGAQALRGAVDGG
jgi:transcription antitermination protein NusB